MTKSNVDLDEYLMPSFYYDIATFCGLIVGLDIIKKIGTPKGEYFIWYDDTEYSLRIRKYTKIKNVNNALVYHKFDFNNKQPVLTWKSYYGYRNQIDVGRKYSKIPLVYMLYRCLYHVYRVLYFSFLSTMHSSQSTFLEYKRLHQSVLKDVIRSKLGINTEYLPGKNI